jgi:cell division protein FtsL
MESPDSMTETPPQISRAFLVITFVVAIVVAVAIIYFGINGQIGGPIP